LDPTTLPGTVEIPGVDDPYPFLAAARRSGAVQSAWPFPGDLDIDPANGSSFSVLGHDEVVAVLRDNESFSSSILSDIMGPMLGRTIIAMDEPEHRA
jgi:cytochrome P450